MEELKSILVVEDDPELNDYISTIFSKEHQVYRAFDGLEGCLIAREKLPDLIISDVKMPYMNGFELAKKLKNESGTELIPIILLTSLNSEKDLVEGIRKNADIYLTKPFSSLVLRAYVDSLIQSRSKLLAKNKNNELINIDNDAIKSSDEKFLIKLKEIIAQNISNASLDNQTLTSELNVSYRTLIRRVKSLTGNTIHEIIKKIRLKKAAHLLKTSNLTITEISDECGFSEAAYFSRCFTNEYGTPPSQYSVKKC